ncbi:MAG: tungstate transport system substrate-binding protein [Solirubrobacteraceae bacterium]|nr:tungstate transport system substrate-binding protein [Solirubrobacteraceae bacterium]
MRSRVLGMAAGAALLAGVAGTGAQADTIRVQSTTDTVDAGLVAGLLQPAYMTAQPGDALQYTAVGTGKALTNAEAGLADVVITHAPSLEAQFVSAGFSLEPVGRAIFYSDYVIVGPPSDPAHVLTADPHDAVGALEAIAAAGGASAADFVSRGDNSGTNVQEQIMWGLTGTVTLQTAFNAGTDTTRSEPGSGGAIPIWYHRTTKGQAANVLEADACPTSTYPSGACYTITDRGTFNKLVNAGTVTRLKILSEHNSAGARGGQNLLINPFSAYIVNPAGPLPGGSPAPNVAAATRFLDFLTSPAFQAAVDTFPTTTDPAFHADAFPAVSLAPPLPPTALAGSALTIQATLTNKLPGSPPINGMPVQLQQSTDGGRTYANLGAPVNTNAAGALALTTTLAGTTSFRLSTPRFQTLSPDTQDLGVVSVAPPTVTTPPVTTPTPKDKTPPRITATTLTARTFSFTISEAGAVRVTIARRITTHVRKGTRVTYKTVRTFTFKVGKPGRLTGTSKQRLPAGTYRVTVRATDLAGNLSTRTVHPHIKSR